MNYFAYLVMASLYEFLFLVCSLPVLALLGFFFRTWSNIPVIRVTVGILSIIWLAGGLRIAHQVARRQVFKNEGFGQAIGSAFSEVRLVISFLPVVGTLFPLRSREESPFDRPDDPRPL